MLFGALFIIDFIIGKFFTHIANNIHSGVYGRDNYISNEAVEDVLIFGSSRALHHYNAPMITDSLGLSCYNCGDDGCGIILSYGRLKMAKERHTPRIIIQDILYSFDIKESDNSKFLGFLKSHYDRAGIPEMFDSIDKLEKYKMFSYLYRYNSKYHQLLFSYLTDTTKDPLQGFRPSVGKLDKLKLKKKSDTSIIVDSLKISYVNKFIDISQDSKLYFVVSPIWYGLEPQLTQPIKDICTKRGITYLDFSNSPKYVHKDKYFRDGLHLNIMGADEFTKDLLNIISSDIKKKK